MTKKIDTIDVHVEIPTPPFTPEYPEGWWEAEWRTRAEAAGAVGSYIFKNPKTSKWDMVVCFDDPKLMMDFAKHYQSLGTRDRHLRLLETRTKLKNGYLMKKSDYQILIVGPKRSDRNWGAAIALKSG